LCRFVSFEFIRHDVVVGVSVWCNAGVANQRLGVWILLSFLGLTSIESSNLSWKGTGRIVVRNAFSTLAGSHLAPGVSIRKTCSFCSAGWIGPDLPGNLTIISPSVVLSGSLWIKTTDTARNDLLVVVGQLNVLQAVILLGCDKLSGCPPQVVPFVYSSLVTATYTVAYFSAAYPWIGQCAVANCGCLTKDQCSILGVPTGISGCSETRRACTPVSTLANCVTSCDSFATVTYPDCGSSGPLGTVLSLCPSGTPPPAVPTCSSRPLTCVHGGVCVNGVLGPVCKCVAPVDGFGFSGSLW